MPVVQQSSGRRSFIPDMLPPPEPQSEPSNVAAHADNGDTTYTTSTLADIETSFTQNSPQSQSQPQSQKQQLQQQQQESDSQRQRPRQSLDSQDDDSDESSLYAHSDLDDSGDSDYEDAEMIPSTDHVETCAALAVPALPVKNSLRPAGVLYAVPQKPHHFATQQPVLTRQPPHEVYMSSEEDASSSADDFSDFDFDSEDDNDASPDSPNSRSSRQDTARMVSVIFSGKPSLINLSRRAISPSSTLASSLGSSIRTSFTDSGLAQSNSAHSAASSWSSTSSRPRTSSRDAENFDSPKLDFLETDPFAAKLRGDDKKGKAAGMLKKTFSLVRKRSKPVLAQPQYSLDNSSVPVISATTEQREALPRSSMAALRQRTLPEHGDSRPSTSTARERIRSGLSGHRRRNSLIRI